MEEKVNFNGYKGSLHTKNRSKNANLDIFKRKFDKSKFLPNSITQKVYVILSISHNGREEKDEDV